jgi:hypothetical protein
MFKSYFGVYFLISAFIFGLSSEDLSAQNNNLRTAAPEFIPKLIPYNTDNPSPVWAAGPPIPVGRFRGGGVGFTRLDTGFVLVFGGDLSGNGPATSDLQIYNARTITWTPGAPMQIAVMWNAGAFLRDSLYSVFSIGGATGIAFATVTDVVQMYSFTLGAWQPRTNLPAARGAGKAVGYQDSLVYYVGGLINSPTAPPASEIVYLYNTITNTWRTATSLPAPRAGFALGISGDTLVVVCGATGYQTGYTNVVYRGVISQSNRSVISWTTGANYPGMSRWRMDAASWQNRGIIVIGGAPSGFTGSNECYFYSPSNNTWTSLPNRLTTACGTQGGVVRNAGNSWKCIVAGGYNAGVTTATDILTDSLGLVGIINKQVPAEYELKQNYPNPFNPTTIITFSIPGKSYVRLSVFDILGREVLVLVDGSVEAGEHEVSVDAGKLSGGVYYYRMQAGSYTETKKMTLIK